MQGSRGVHLPRVGPKRIPAGRLPRMKEVEMTLCPIALAVGCNKCPALQICPLKGVIGDYKKPDKAAPKPPPNKTGGTGRNG